MKAQRLKRRCSASGRRLQRNLNARPRRAMGLGPASLYNAFGDKRALFARCLDHYLDANMRARIKRFETTLPPRRAIEAFLPK